MDRPAASPRIAGLSWGRLDLEGGASYKDAKLYPGGSRAWDWDETGTRHEPGIQPADVEELLDNGARVVVLSMGVHGRLRVPPETLRLLEDRKIPVHVLRTEEAVRAYNDLREKTPVGGLFHTTC